MEFAVDFNAFSIPRARVVRQSDAVGSSLSKPQTPSKESPTMGSIKKKRRAKMSKHKHDKRIKLERHKTK